MKKVIAMLVVLSYGSSWAIELLCNGERQRNKGQRVIAVDCTDRKAVADILGAAWVTLQDKQVTKMTSDMCFRQYDNAKGLNPAIPMRNDLAQFYFATCNIPLKDLP